MLHGDANTHVWCLAPFLSYHLIPRGRKNIWILQTLLLPMAGIGPGPPVQQASALSITPLPLGKGGVLSIRNTQILNFDFYPIHQGGSSQKVA